MSLLTGKASLDVNAAWRRAAVEAQAPLVQALADHPELDVHSTVPEVNKTVGLRRMLYSSKGLLLYGSAIAQGRWSARRAHAQGDVSAYRA